MAGVGTFTPTVGNQGQDFVGTGSNRLTSSQAASIYGITAQLNQIPVVVKRGGGKPDPKTGHATDQVTNYLHAVVRPQSWTSDQIGSLQQMLMQAGYLKNSPSNPVTPGMYDDATTRAYEAAVLQAAKAQTTTTELLSSQIAQRQAAGIDTGNGTASPVRLTNPADLRAAAIQAGQQLLGMNPDEQFINNFVSSFHAAEVGGQKSAAVGGTYTDAGNPETVAESQLKAQRPNQVKAGAVTQGLTAIDNLIQKTKGNS